MMISTGTSTRPRVRLATPRDRVPWRLLLSADRPRVEVEEYLARGELWLAERESEVVGEMVLVQAGADAWEVMNLAVARCWHRHGIGTLLLRKARAVARRR